jgi:flavodoxin
MKSLVVYSSQTGNSYKLAKAFWEGLPGTQKDKRLCSIDAVPDVKDYEFVALSFWLKGGKPDPKAEAFLPKVGAKPLFLLATHGAAKGSSHAAKGLEAAKELAPQAKITGTYSCQGEVAPAVLEMAQSKPEPPEWLADASTAQGHPNNTELDEVRGLAGQISLG